MLHTFQMFQVLTGLCVDFSGALIVTAKYTSFFCVVVTVADGLQQTATFPFCQTNNVIVWRIAWP